MKKIVLLCNMGMSTSSLMSKMRTYAAQIGFECEINAYPVSEAVEKGKNVDCVLLGPQIAYQLNRVREELPKVPVEAIDMRAYGMMDASKVIDQAKKIMKVV
ncbi:MULTISPECIES: PTS sugar transporter subunit IIB [unclassified Enterococcus]|uniref:PTS sugar transporter subunit IIB n=1 Tax=unclassified Enterococcus TaxID=2608891 RepID=UPI000A32E343|nr:MULTISPECIES: PTS sugar transporter subunit IIB [unclassified Enterococcus]OTO77371.1 hypothetical protein A5865_001247 [Enterococcus sp. 12E11_DIV0728]OUZ16454.1 hypothetical protein A5868_001375 [Enterococcus sp. 12F9_DIV0723]